jgi:hypothetical protein
MQRPHSSLPPAPGIPDWGSSLSTGGSGPPAAGCRIPTARPQIDQPYNWVSTLPSPPTRLQVGEVPIPNRPRCWAIDPPGSLAANREEE